MEKEYYTKAEVCEIFTITGKTLRRWDLAGKFPNAIGEGKERRYPIADVEALKVGKQEVEGSKVEDNPLWIEAKRKLALQKLSEEEAKSKAEEAESKAKEQASMLAFDTPETYRAAQKELLEKITKADEHIADQVAETKAHLFAEIDKAKELAIAHHEKAQKYEPENKELRELCLSQSETIKKLQESLGIKEEAEAKLIDTTTQFNENLPKGVAFLKRIGGSLKRDEIGGQLGRYLLRQAVRLEQEGVEYEWGMEIFSGCSQSMVSFMQRYEEDGNAGMGNWLYERDVKLHKIMAMPEERDVMMAQYLTSQIEQWEAKIKDFSPTSTQGSLNELRKQRREFQEQFDALNSYDKDREVELHQPITKTNAGAN